MFNSYVSYVKLPEGKGGNELVYLMNPHMLHVWNIYQHWP